jgi:hypothetical protein
MYHATAVRTASLHAVGFHNPCMRHAEMLIRPPSQSQVVQLLTVLVGVGEVPHQVA